MAYKYVIVGGGPAAASAVEGIRKYDPHGSLLMLSRENHPPYHRPYLSKDLWFGKHKLDDLPLFDEAFYRDHKVELKLRREVVELDPEKRTVWDDLGDSHGYEKLLLATGGRPKPLDVDGSEHQDVRYFRSLEDYLMLEQRASRLQHVLVIGGGFIATELAAALQNAGKEVSFMFPHDYPLQRILPRDLGTYVAEEYRRRGIEMISNETVLRFDDHADLIVARTRRGNTITSQLALVGVGLLPHTELADAAGLEVGSGIEVDEYARTTDANIWAAGDVAEFPYLALGRQAHIEHWDHALSHGRAAGANMAGANLPYTHIPMFYGDLFDLGFEAAGDLDASLPTHAVWREPNREGVVFYLRDDVIRGVLLWNVWDKVDWARELIREAGTMSHEEREALVAQSVAG